MRVWLGVVALASFVACKAAGPGAGHIHITGAPDASGTEVINQFSGDGLKHMVTGTDGAYDFDNSELPGVITVINEWTVEGTKQWSTRSGVIDSYPDITLTAAGDVFGVATLNGQFDGNAGITVEIDGESKATDEFGDFLFDKLAVGVYPVRVFAVGYHEVDTTVTVTYGTTAAIPDITLEAD